MLAGEARKTTSRNSSGEENYIYGDYHAFREARNNSSSNSLEEITPVRRSTKQTLSKNLSLAWSTESSTTSSNKTQIELINSKYFRPTAPTNLTQNLGTLNVNSPLKPAENEQDGTFDQRADGIFSQKQDSFGFNDDDFLSDDAADRRLAEDEEEFENSNMLLLPDDLKTDAVSIYGENDTKNISQFFCQDNNELGLEGTCSPEKAPFKVPVVPVEYGGASETFCLGQRESEDRRDTVSTIKSMPYSIFETTQGVANYHEHLKSGLPEQELSSASFSWRRMQDEHQQLKDKQFDDTLDISVECSHAKDRFSLDTVTSDLLSEHPKSQSSPSKSDSSADTTRNLDSIDVYDSTQSNIEELCKTSCGFKTLHQNGETGEQINLDFVQSDNRLTLTSDTSSVSSKGTRLKMRRSSGRSQHRANIGRFASLPTVSGNSQMLQHPPQAFQPIRPYSPLPLVEFLPEIDFSTPVFIGDSATQMLPVHATNTIIPAPIVAGGLHMPQGPPSWLKLGLAFRTIHLDSVSVMDQSCPFVLRQSEFHIAPGQDISVPIHFRPKCAGRYMAILEIRVQPSPPNQYPSQYPPNQQPSQPYYQEQVHTINLIAAAIAPKIKIGDGSGEFEIGHGNNKLDISNLSSYDVPLVVEIDREFSLSIQNEQVNRFILPKQSTLTMTLAASFNGMKQSGKLKIYLDGKEKTIVDWCLVKVRAPSVELSGPTEPVNMKAVAYAVATVQIPIYNCGKDVAAINARIDGRMAELIQCSPETATIPADGELIFSLKYSAGAAHQTFEHYLIRKYHSPS